MKILLVQPKGSERMVGFTEMICPEPLALEIIAATVPQHEVKILDMRVDTDLESMLSSFKPKIVGVTGYTTNVPGMWQVCQDTKAYDKRITTVVGGYHASLCPEDFDREYVDVIVVGEGEETFPELVSTLAEKRDLSGVRGIIYRRDGHQVTTPLRDLIPDLDRIPLPARHLSDQYREHYHFHFWENPYLVETARGCPYRCTFCAVWKFHRKRCRTKSPERVLEDLKGVGSRIVCFVDDNFFQNLRRSDKMYHLIKEAGIKGQYWIQARADSIVRRPDIVEKWASIGLDAALVGFEKIREDELANMGKRSSLEINNKAIEIMNRNNVDMWGSFIIDPQWTAKDFDDLIDYVRKGKIFFPLFTVLTPIPGTQFFQEKVNELITRNYEVFDFLHTVLPTKMPLEEFYANMARLYGSTTMGWGELKRRVRSGRIPVSSLARVREVLKSVTDPSAYLKSWVTA